MIVVEKIHESGNGIRTSASAPRVSHRVLMPTVAPAGK
jgi:hypothetical protein